MNNAIHQCNIETIKSQLCQKANYNNNTKPNKFRVGDLVWVHNFREGKRWLPGTITKQIGNVLYKVSIKDQNTSWHQHANQLHTRIEWVPETNSEPTPTVTESPTETVVTPPLRRSTYKSS